MQIRRLMLTNFRTYAHVDLTLSAGTNVFVGANAQGKSTLLEAAHLLATSRSPVAGRESEMIRWGCEEASVAATVARDLRSEVRIEFLLSRTGGREMRVNDCRRTRVLEVVGQLNVVLFSAEDLELVRGEPAIRRRFLNLTIAQVSPQYCQSLLQYRRALEQRNRLLKIIRDTGKSDETLEVWSEQLVAAGSRLVQKRMEFIRELHQHAGHYHEEIGGAGEVLSVSYLPGLPLQGTQPVEDQFYNRLRALRREEIARGTTLAGPHRDEVRFEVNGVDARVYASHGQQRTVALAVRLAQVQLMHERVGEPPVVLLDDAGPELDGARRGRLFSLVRRGCQSLITCTSLEALPEGVAGEATCFRVEAGRVREE
ncbi:MAG: DNA replication/repair protein RecF [Armatimonadota bacterium]|nr:DNA replication/repair protein RecF [Armatimonadota bacterium]